MLPGQPGGSAASDERPSPLASRLATLWTGTGRTDGNSLMAGLVLIIEDEPVLGRNMRTFLQSQGHRCELADTIAAGTRLR